MKKERNFNPFLCAVYGTLKRGFNNNRVLADSEFIGECYSENKFTMYSINDWFPGVIEDGEASIKLEVFKVVDSEIANNLDRLEGYPDMYCKTTINTVFGKATMYVYNNNVTGRKVIKSGNWRKLW